MKSATSPVPFVVRSTVPSWMIASLPSLVTLTSTSSMSEPSSIERSNAYIVAEGASSSPPWWVMLSARSFVQSVGPALAAAGRISANSAPTVISASEAPPSSNTHVNPHVGLLTLHRLASLVGAAAPAAVLRRARSPE